MLSPLYLLAARELKGFPLTEEMLRVELSGASLSPWSSLRLVVVLPSEMVTDSLSAIGAVSSMAVIEISILAEFD